jgi:hypothetical protein
MRLAISLDAGRTACTDSIAAFLRAVNELSEYDLLGESRCHGWTRLDVVVHVTAGWQEMLGGLVSIVDSKPTVDAASYWSAFALEYAGEDPILSLMSQRRRASLYTRPASAKTQLNDVAAAVLRGVSGLRDRAYAWQGHVFAAGDFAAVWRWRMSCIISTFSWRDLRRGVPFVWPARQSRRCSARRCHHPGTTRMRR